MGKPVKQGVEAMTRPEIYFGDCLDVITTFETGAFDLIYIDPPFNTGRAQSRKRLKTVRDDKGDRGPCKGYDR